MNCQLAKSAGFCFGVKRAVQVVYDQIDQAQGPIYTYGPIIHNTEVVKEMEARGVCVIHSPEELTEHEPGIIIIRSHGVSRKERETMISQGYQVVDATCPFVLKIHRLVEKHSSAGEEILIIGNAIHPEVCGIKGWCAEGAKVSVISSAQEARDFTMEVGKKLCIVSQTTFNLKKFQELVEIIQEKGYDICVLNTICSATEERQTEAREIASHSDAMIVIGDPKSSNTQKLFEICKNECENTYYIQTSKDMDYTDLHCFDNVGITAGASTPNNIIEEVSKNVRNEL